MFMYDMALYTNNYQHCLCKAYIMNLYNNLSEIYYQISLKYAIKFKIIHPYIQGMVSINIIVSHEALSNSCEV